MWSVNKSDRAAANLIALDFSFFGVAVVGYNESSRKNCCFFRLHIVGLGVVLLLCLGLALRVDSLDLLFHQQQVVLEFLHLAVHLVDQGVALL